MPVPTLITELSTTAASNSPPGSESPASLDDYQRTHASFIAQIRDGTVSVAGTGLTGTAAALSIGGTAANLSGGAGGTIPYQSAAGVTAMLANGTAGQVLQSNGTTLAPSYATPAAGVSPSATTPLVDTSAGAVGTGTTYARNDHSHPALASSLAANGYQKFPSGLILQWGTTAALGQSTSITVTLPIAFTTTVYSVTATMNGSFDSGVTEAGVSVSASGLTQIIIGKGTNAAGAGTSRPVAWMAVGV